MLYVNTYLIFECWSGFMALFDREIDITRNIKIIEWLKSELLTDIANLSKCW